MMADAERKDLPKMVGMEGLAIDNDITEDFSQNPAAWEEVRTFPELYLHLRHQRHTTRQAEGRSLVPQTDGTIGETVGTRKIAWQPE